MRETHHEGHEEHEVKNFDLEPFVSFVRFVVNKMSSLEYLGRELTGPPL
jgi:hypothetical protein